MHRLSEKEAKLRVGLVMGNPLVVSWWKKQLKEYQDAFRLEFKDAPH